MIPPLYIDLVKALAPGVVVMFGLSDDPTAHGTTRSKGDGTYTITFSRRRMTDVSSNENELHRTALHEACHVMIRAGFAEVDPDIRLNWNAVRNKMKSLFHIRNDLLIRKTIEVLDEVEGPIDYRKVESMVRKTIDQTIGELFEQALPSAVEEAQVVVLMETLLDQAVGDTLEYKLENIAYGIRTKIPVT